MQAVSVQERLPKTSNFFKDYARVRCYLYMIWADMVGTGHVGKLNRMVVPCSHVMPCHLEEVFVNFAGGQIELVVAAQEVAEMFEVLSKDPTVLDGMRVARVEATD